MSVIIVNADNEIYFEGDGTPDLSLATQIIFNYTDVNGAAHNIVIPSSAFLIQHSTFIAIKVPDHCNFTTQIISVDLDLTGTQFSGSVALGPNTVLVINGSGIYRIVADKTNDTVYVDSSVGSGTTDVKIPNPFAKTGFIGG